MQIRTTVGYQLTPVGLAIIEKEEEGEEVGGRAKRSRWKRRLECC